MEQLLHQFILRPADVLRGSLLSQTKKSTLLRRLYVDRTMRIGVSFLIATIAYFFIATLMPIFALVIGPLTYGVPHLFASYRYTTELAFKIDSKQKGRVFVWFFSILGVLVFLFHTHLLSPSYLPSFIHEHSAGLEMTACACFLACVFFSNQMSFRKCGVVLILLAPIVASLLYRPLQTLSALVLIHNAIAFPYWIASAKARTADQKLAIAGFIAFLLIHMVILVGWTDFLFKLIDPKWGWIWGKVHFLEIGDSITGGQTSSKIVLRRVVSAYAFGQALHYFVWLKAIPESLRRTSVPACFQQSYREAKVDLGRTILVFAVVMWLAYLGATFLMNSYKARIAYLSFAAFHGYAEIVGLAFLCSPLFTSRLRA